MKVILKYRGDNKILIYEIEDKTVCVLVTIKHKRGSITKDVLSYLVYLRLEKAVKQIKKMISDSYILEHERRI